MSKELQVARVSQVGEEFSQRRTCQYRDPKAGECLVSLSESKDARWVVLVSSRRAKVRRPEGQYSLSSCITWGLGSRSRLEL